MTALTRAAIGVGPAAPVQVVHLGLGIFHRTHQAWYTHQASALGATSGIAPSGIAAFTGRSPAAALPLQAQDGLYHIIIRGRDGDSAELITSLSAAHAGSDLSAWLGYLASPTVQCLTMTVTEAGYQRSPSGTLDRFSPTVAADISLLGGNAPLESSASTAPGRIVQGLLARMQSSGAPVALVSCDNLLSNGDVCSSVVLELAAQVSPTLESWISSEVSFVSTMVDRITPKTTSTDLSAVQKITGYDDAAAVVAEPFTEWVLAGSFPAGRPSWELAGARFVADVHPFEQRKLWLLNGAHSLLAYAGAARGHETVASAMDDPVCLGWLTHWWNEACRHLSLSAPELASYREDLLARFTNPAIRHTLAQIQMDGSQKMPVRILPVVARERGIGVLPLGGVIALAGWLVHLRDGSSVSDPRAAELTELVSGSLESATRRLLAAVDPTSGLADDAELVQGIASCSRDLTGRRTAS